MKRETLQKIIYFLLKNITVTRFEGLENLPDTGGVIVATNHMSRMDIAVLFANPVRTEITALVADKYVKFPIIGWISRWLVLFLLIVIGQILVHFGLLGN